MMGYRNDIDGLRALAILPVVFFHYGLKHPFNGGFVGVDIFFVISGFLITAHIHEGMEQGKFDILDFYNRRIRRILPALFSVLLFCLVLSIGIAIPPEAQNTSRGVLWSILFVSNIFFYNKSGYFDAFSQTNPVLHSWSLSVEEQFYIVIPLLIFITQKFFRISFRHVILVLLVLSFGFCFIKVLHDKPAAFYLTQYRAWEFLLGSFVSIVTMPAIHVTYRVPKGFREIAGWAGIILILGSIFTLNSKSLFPGPGAVAPCLGTALILYSGAIGNSAVSVLLSVRPLRFIGLVSYSLYLWHWPIWVFVSIYYKPDLLMKLFLLMVAFGVSVLSWRFIEQPFRRRPFRLSVKKTIAITGGIMGIMILFALTSKTLNSKIWHYSPAEQTIMSYMTYKPVAMRTGTCFIDRKAEDIKTYKSLSCLDQQAGKKNYLVLGDSHAADRWYGLQQEYPEIHFMQATAPSCEPVMGKGSGKCGALLQYMFRDFIPAHHLDGIILSANWLKKDFDAIIATAQNLQKHADRIIILGPSPEYDQPLPLLLVRGMVKENMAFVSDHLLKDRESLDKILAQRAAQAGIEYISVYAALCSEKTCLTQVENNVPILFDADHFTAVGSVFLARKIELQKIRLISKKP